MTLRSFLALLVFLCGIPFQLVAWLLIVPTIILLGIGQFLAFLATLIDPPEDSDNVT